MRLHFLAASVALAAIAGCYTGSAVDTNRGVQPTDKVVTSTDGTDSTATGTGTGTGTGSQTIATPTGLPCDVSVLLKASCDGCHGATPANGAPDSIVTFEDLTKKSLSDPTKTVAELAVERMQSQSRPMPPDGNLGATEISILSDWVSAGMPKGSCGAATTTPDAGTSTGHGTDPDAGADSSAPPAPPVSVCTSGVTADPNTFGPTMQPGNACVSCHTAEDGPDFQVGGTIYPTKNEPDNCNGVDGTTGATAGTKVLVIDANGTMRAFDVSAAGNFFGGADIAFPYRAMVVRGNSIKEMKSPQMTGDCNSCHTEFGTGAPGRVMEP